MADDHALAAFVASVEYSAVAVYEAALASGKVTTAAVVESLTRFADHHRAHGDALRAAAAGHAGADGPNARLMAVVGTQLADARDEAAVLELAYGIERSAAATHLFALGEFAGADALAPTAAILPVEAQHVVAIGTLVGRAINDLYPGFEPAGLALKPSYYPLG